MKIIITGYNSDSWYKPKMGKVIAATAVTKGYVTKEGLVLKKHGEVVEK
jgi:hypothetical protein